VALVFPVFMLMMTMSGGGLGSGVAAAIARAIGAGRRQEADALVLHAAILAVIVGAVFTIGAHWSGPALYFALGGRNESLDAACVYSGIIFSGAIAVWIANLLSSALRGSGNVTVPAIVTLTGALITIPASPALIFGFGPIPRLGIRGAGLAFAAYYIAAALVLIWYMATGRSGLTLKRAPLEARLFAAILNVGLPAALISVQTNLMVILVTGAVGFFGTEAIAGYGIATRLDYGMIPILFGVASAALTMVGVAIGAGSWARAKQIAWQSSIAGACIAGTIGLIVAIAPGLWLHLFSHEPGVVAAGITYLHFVGLAYGFMGFGFVTSFAVRGAGQVFWPFLGVTARLIIAAGGGWIAVRFFNAGMPTVAAIVAVSLVSYAALSGVAMFSKSAWRSSKGAAN
jgi:putative MATE family efflux protein